MAVLEVDGVSYSTYAGALADAGATDEIDIQIDLTNENCLINKNYARLFSSNGSYIDSTNNGLTIQPTTGFNQLIKFKI